MVAGIVADDEKTEKAQIGFYGVSRRTRRRQQAARGGRALTRPGELTPVGGAGRRWLAAVLRPSAVVRPRERNRGRGERRKRTGT
ncbi:hypothetical protein PanWU01x14_181030 [Parasponia andersonii]|uniref:Uncharacterized protein n=1 Tax=Parasponia andersonii TaxID=3476 RepID=A0A2P5C693_PARAD|nr:hypothetical protein PanWU01x14_181030 [Parasponia andersonii]